jgi:hypothetical protein
MSGARPEASIANGEGSEVDRRDLDKRAGSKATREQRLVSGGWPTGERPPDARTGRGARSTGETSTSERPGHTGQQTLLAANIRTDFPPAV